MTQRRHANLIRHLYPMYTEVRRHKSILRWRPVPWEPTAAKERIVLLDVLRGIAVFGMFTVNMTVDLPWGSAFRQQSLDIANGAVMIAVDLLTSGKFITIFSFLFGVGFFLQLERARGRGVPFLAAYLRRLVALFFIAALATVAGLDVDVLIDYSIFGLLLLLFSSQSARFLLVAAVVCIVIEGVSSNIEAVNDLIVTEQSGQIELVDNRSGPGAIAENERDRIYREGSFREIASYRASGLLKYVLSWKQRLWDASILGLMLLGCYVCRRGALQDSAARTKMARTALPWLLSIGLAGMVISVWLRHFAGADSGVLTLIGGPRALARRCPSSRTWLRRNHHLGDGKRSMPAKIITFRRRWQIGVDELSVSRVCNCCFHIPMGARDCTVKWGRSGV